MTCECNANEPQKQSDVFLSVVVPIYNEQGAIRPLFKEILSVCRSYGKSFEIIFVDDGSLDGSMQEMMHCSPLTVVQLRKNFGQTAAFDAGIKLARGELILTMDGDGQNDPADFMMLLDKMKEGYDVVSGWRKDRKDQWSKRFISIVANMLRMKMINDGIHDSGCALKLYRRACFDAIDLYGEMHRFIPAVLKIKGFRVGEVIVNHRARKTGKTKYNWRRAIKGLLDMFSVWFWKKYANRPLHLFGASGLVFLSLSFISVSLAIYQKIALMRDLSDTVLTELAMVTFITGVLLVLFGLIADMVSKTYFASSRDRAYDVKQVIQF